MSTKKIKINFKMPTPTAAERLHAQQQKNRKAAGLPDPSEYKKKLDSMKSEEVELDEAKKMEYNQKDVYHLRGCVEELESMKKKISKLAGNHDAVFKTIDKAIDIFAKEYTKHLNALSAGRGQSDDYKVAELFSTLKFKKSKKTNEEVESLEEISPQLKASYIAGAKKQIKQSEPYTKKGEEYRDIAKNFIAKRQKGIARANEEVEQLDEIGDTSAGRKALGNYINRSHESGDAARIQATYDKDNFAKHTKTAAKRSSGIAKAVTRLTKEQLEKKGRFVSGPIKQPFKSNTIVTAVKEGFRIGGMSSGSRGNVHEYDRNPPAKDGNELENVPFHAKTEKQKKIQNALNDLGKKMKETHPKLKEDLGDKIKIRKKGTNITKEISSAAYSVFKHHGFRKEETIQEGRPSQRHPLEGHEYHKKSDEALVHIAKDAHAAAEAMKGHNTAAENKYRDQANDSATVRYYRQKHGMADWYKKKYGHVKEEAEEPSMAARTLSRKAQIVKAAAKSKKAAKEESSDKFQKDPELSSDIHKT